MARWLVAFLLLLLGGVSLPADDTKKRPIEVDDLYRLKRVADPQISPDGTQVVYAVTEVDLAGNKTITHLWLAPVGGGKPRQLTNAPRSDRHPRWSPDGRFILFESGRSGSNQLWIIDPTGGEAKQLTTISTGASTGLWSRDGKQIAFVSAVYPEFSDKPFKQADELNQNRLAEIEKDPVKVRIFTKLFFRHWNDYVGDKRQHLFVAAFNADTLTLAEPRNVTPGDRDAYPTSSTFSVGDDFTFSPDGTHLIFTAVPERDEAWSTNYELCRVPVGGGKIETLTAGNPAADGAPRFSPDGKRLAYRAQRRPGFEADRWELMLVPTEPSGAFAGTPRSLTPEFDSSAEEFSWKDEATLVFAAEDRATRPLWRVGVKGGVVARFDPQPVPALAGMAGSPTFSADGNQFTATAASMRFPPEVYTVRPVSGDRAEFIILSSANMTKSAFALDGIETPRPESVTVPGAGGTPMQMWILKPPGFDPNKKWPLVYLVHGGPQGAWEDGWSFRWNPQVWAAQGYVIALPNPRGSTGFGQKYVDEISGDWGGKCFQDLMAGMDFLEKQPYIDRSRTAAAGASFGGYMVNFFAGNTDRFKTLISHCGVYNFDSMYALTDELWFDEWEHGGPPWLKRDSYEKHSPHKFAAKFKTPTLIIHNDLDFRVPVSEGLQFFTTLQRLGVPSRMVNFPDEGHWVLKPANGKRWHREVFDWLKRYVPPGGK